MIKLYQLYYYLRYILFSSDSDDIITWIFHLHLCVVAIVGWQLLLVEHQQVVTTSGAPGPASYLQTWTLKKKFKLRRGKKANLVLDVEKK